MTKTAAISTKSHQPRLPSTPRITSTCWAILMIFGSWRCMTVPVSTAITLPNFGRRPSNSIRILWSLGGLTSGNSRKWRALFLIGFRYSPGCIVCIVEKKNFVSLTSIGPWRAWRPASKPASRRPNQSRSRTGPRSLKQTWRKQW